MDCLYPIRMIVVCLAVVVCANSGATHVFAQAQRAGTAHNKTAPQTQGRPPATPSSKTAVPNKQDAVAATVNGQTITRADLGRETVVRYGSQVLENILNKKLILQACEQQRIQITDTQVGAEIAKTAERFNLTMDQYLKLIKEDRGIAPEQYAADIVWPMLALRELARDQIKISPQEIDRAIDSEYGPKVQVRMIQIKDPQKVKQIHQQAVADPSQFRRLAKEHSEEPESASVEGILPPIRRYSGDDVLERVAFSLKPNEVSQIFSIADSYYILQCVRHIPATPPLPAQLAAIQKQYQERIAEEKLRDSAGEILMALQKQSKIVKVLDDKQLEAQHPGVAAYINNEPISMALLTEECLKRHASSVLTGEINRKILEGALAQAKLQVVQADLDAEIKRAAAYYGKIKNDGSPDVEAWLKDILDEEGATYDLYIRDMVWPTVALKKLVAGRVQVTEEDMQKGFESTYGPRAEILAIVFSNQRTASEVWQRARDNNTDQFFGELAAQYSVETTSKTNFGKVAPLRRHGGQPKLEEEAFRLQPGQMSSLIEVSGKWIILRLQGFTEPVVKDFNAVKDYLYADLLEKKSRIAMQEELDKLMANAQIDNYVDQKSQVPKQLLETAQQPTAANSPQRR